MAKESKKKQKIGSLIKNILAAGIGVQSDKNRQEDFAGGNPLAFIIGGFIFTIVFILCVAVVVGLVLSNAN
ncbi:MAG TPA: DUF2970 domain-containing protein [Porticoccaceae bacterium]|nr:DUF2970 domain-containing protein [Porticoccaceae bacterium]HIK80154.1 DUF2970 domain-containing protein [Porticoccaceae bacterium]